MKAEELSEISSIEELRKRNLARAFKFVQSVLERAHERAHANALIGGKNHTEIVNAITESSFPGVLPAEILGLINHALVDDGYDADVRHQEEYNTNIKKLYITLRWK